MMTIVVTGGICSGKSLVCRMLSEKLPLSVLYEADVRARELYTREFLEQLENDFRTVLIDAEGKLLKDALADIIFNDSCKRSHLESLLFPLMEEDFRKTAEGARYVLFESATVLEKTYFDGFGDKVILVDAPLQVRLSRACKRDGAAENLIMQRIKAQPLMNAFSRALEDGTFEMLPQAAGIDTVISNTGDVESLEKQINKFIETIL